MRSFSIIISRHYLLVDNTPVERAGAAAHFIKHTLSLFIYYKTLFLGKIIFHADVVIQQLSRLR